MKKFVALLLAMLIALSATVVSFAETYPEEGNADYVCDYCGAGFLNAASLADHIAATFPYPNHDAVCAFEYDKNHDGEITADEVCTFCTKYRATLEAHQKDECEFKDTETNWEKAVAYFKAGTIGLGFKYLGKVIVEFLKSDTFKNILNKVVDAVKGIDLSGVFSTVKGLFAKIPFDTLLAKVKGLINR